MKTFVQSSILALLILSIPSSIVMAQTGVAINNSGAAPDANAMLDITSTTKGVLVPRVTTGQRTAINPTASSDFGLLVYDTDLGAFFYWDGGLWQEVPNVANSGNTLDEAYDEGGPGVGRVINATNGNVEITGSGYLTVASNIGVGTTAPDRRMKVSGTGWTALEVENTDNQDAALELTSQGVSSYVFTDNTGFLGIQSAIGQDIVFNTNGTNERLRIKSGGSVGVGTASPDAQSILELSSTTKGLLIPRMSTTQRNTIGVVSGQDQGLTIYNTTTTFYEYWDGTAWQQIPNVSSLDADDDWYQVLSTNTPTAIGDWIYTNGRVGIGVGAARNPSAPLEVAAAGSGNPSANSIIAYNETASSGQDAIITARVNGASAGDPFFSMDINGEAGWSMGVDNDHGNRFKIAPSWSNLSSSTALTIQTDGNVGVGTTGPAERLSVTGTNVDAYPALGLRSGNDNNGFNNGAQISFGYNGTSTYQHFIQTRHNSAVTQNAIDFYVSNGTEYNTVTSGSTHVMSLVSGNVGVGTTAPASVIHVSTTQVGNVSKLHNPSLANGSLIGHEFGKANSANNMVEFRYNHVSDGNTSNWVNLGLWGNANSLTVAGTGNVGVGTTSASQKLHVVGGGRFTSLGGGGDRLVYSNNNGDLIAASPAINVSAMVDGSGAANRVTYWSDANTLTSSPEFLYSSTGNLSVFNPETSTAEVRLGAAWNRPGIYSSAELQLFSDATGIIFGDSDIERMRLTAAGNLGIGNTNPLYKLQVNGTTEASAYYVNHGSGNVLEIGDDAWLADINSANFAGIYGQSTSTHGGLRLGNSGYIYSNGTANIGVGTTTPSGRLHVAAGEGDGIVIGLPNDNMGNNGGSTSIKFYGYRDVVSNAIGAKISAERTNVCCGWLSQGTELTFSTNDGLTTSNADNSVERVRITGSGTLQAKYGIQTEKNYYYFQRYKYCNCYGAGNGSWDVGYYDFCAVAQVGFKNNQSSTDEDDDVQCAVYPDGHAGYGEQTNYNVSFTYGYASRPHWQMYAEAYEDSNGVTCAASCINFD